MRNILLVIALLALPVVLFSQDFKGGVSLGVSATQVDGESQAGYNKLGIIFGGYVKRKLNEKIGGQFELKYIDKGSHKSDHPDQGDYTRFTIRLRYVEMPFLLTYTMKELYTFEAGIAVAYLIEYKYFDSNGILNTPDNPFRHFDYSSVIGFNYKISEKLSASIMYSYSIISIKKKLDPNSWYNNVFRKGLFNNVLGFSLKYSF